MYTEFILIFAGLGIIIVFLLIILILLIVLIKKSSNDLTTGAFMTVPTSAVASPQPAASVYGQVSSYQQGSSVSGQPSQGGSVAFCKNCYTQFDASAQFCPKCGSPRN